MGKQRAGRGASAHSVVDVALLADRTSWPRAFVAEVASARKVAGRSRIAPGEEGLKGLPIKPANCEERMHAALARRHFRVNIEAIVDRLRRRTNLAVFAAVDVFTGGKNVVDLGQHQDDSAIISDRGVVMARPRFYVPLSRLKPARAAYASVDAPLPARR
jgi:hypothetical protein